MAGHRSITELYFATLEGKEDPEEVRRILRSMLKKRFSATLERYPSMREDILQEIELVIQLYLNKKPEQIKARGFDVVRAVFRDATRRVKKVLLLSLPITFPEDTVETIFLEAWGNMQVVNLTLRPRNKGKERIKVSSLSPDQESDEDEGGSWKEEIEEPSGLDRIKERYLARIISAMTRLTEEEREVVRLKHFPPEGEELTFARIAKQLGISNARVSRLYNSAIKKIKNLTDKDII